MKVIIASTVIPFIESEGAFIVDWLELKLREYGHQVDIIKIPYSSNHKDMLSQMLALRLYHLEDVCDRLICIRTPSYLIRHPNKYLWFIHHYRAVYDLWNTEFDSLPKDSETLAVREFIIRSDNVAFSEAKKIFALSKNISKRLADFNGIDAEPLYLPILDPEQFYCDNFEDYIYFAGRICIPRRQLLAIQAMRYTKSNVKLLITGKSDQANYTNEIYKYIKKYHMEKKITIVDELIAEKQKIKYFAKCLAVLDISFNADYSYTPLEALHSRKPVITCTDSGYTNELIVNRENGLVLDPDPKLLAKSFDELYYDRHTAEKMGERGGKRISELGITWNNVIRRLTQ